MRGYTLIEPDIYLRLDWDRDLIIKCLEVIRIQMSQIISQKTALIEYDLIAVSNPHGLPYPAIGMHCPTETDWNTLPDISQIEYLTNQWIEQISLDTLIEKASSIDYIDWEWLRSKGTFPNSENIKR